MAVNAAETGSGEALGFRPLYRQVRDTLVARLARGEWQPGDALPTEPELAASLGVSQGTVRKALDALEGENLVVRRQGRGTYVARHDDARVLFQFYRLVPDEGPPAFPDSRVLRVRTAPATAAAARALGMAPRAPTLVIDRLREARPGAVRIVERITLPRALFPGLGDETLPNNLYALYAGRYGVTIARAAERLKAVAARPRAAALLGVAPGAPLLQVDRTAYALDGQPAEWRVSLCLTTDVHYQSDLR